MPKTYSVSVTFHVTADSEAAAMESVEAYLEAGLPICSEPEYRDTFRAAYVDDCTQHPAPELN